GADVFRLNMSHGTQESIAKLHSAIRQVEQEVGRPIGILADLQGPKLRVGMPHPEIFIALHKGTPLLLDDGKIRLEVEEVGEDWATAKVVVGGPLSSRKGVNVPRTVLPLEPLTEKDRKDLDFVLKLGVDWVALSFVQRAHDLVGVREIIGDRAGLIAKIEKPAALGELDAIVEKSDAVMVARGDLGVEMAVEDVPGAQKSIIDNARHHGKLVVVATQMLESMTHSPVPTRAEVSDVANAVFEGADAVMLSAESAAGEYPVEAVTMMDRVGRKIERDPRYRSMLAYARTPAQATSADAITEAARHVAETLEVAAIITYTTSGSTALRAARERPDAPILVITPRLETARRLALCWGLHCVHGEDAENFSEMVSKARLVSLREGMGQPGDYIIITAGVPFGTPGRTNILRIAKIETDTQEP
ncbi:MAG: pyruvate kinase, partial [Alphaproteobacteria bacterium]|nr:pyruvate kinase [Alphaproteobacteria bacterium]